jgi:hypothetical protein
VRHKKPYLELHVHDCQQVTRDTEHSTLPFAAPLPAPQVVHFSCAVAPCQTCHAPHFYHREPVSQERTGSGGGTVASRIIHGSSQRYRIGIEINGCIRQGGWLPVHFVRDEVRGLRVNLLLESLDLELPLPLMSLCLCCPLDGVLHLLRSLLQILGQPATKPAFSHLSIDRAGSAVDRAR